MAKETCVMCGADLSGIGIIRRFTSALIFGNKSRDPHVGPYCENCVPPAIAELVECVEDCPLTDAKWIPVDGNCITKHAPYPHTRIKCEFSLGISPLRHGISCIHPDRLKERKKAKKARLLKEFTSKGDEGHSGSEKISAHPSSPDRESSEGPGEEKTAVSVLTKLLAKNTGYPRAVYTSKEASG